MAKEAERRLSDDEEYYWDGTRWQPAPTLRVDWVWNGEAWQVARWPALTSAGSAAEDPVDEPADPVSSVHFAAAAVSLVLCGGTAALLIAVLSEPLRRLGLPALMAAVAAVPILLISAVYRSTRRWFESRARGQESRA